MKVHYPKLYNMAHLLALNVLLLPKDLTLTIIFIVCCLAHRGSTCVFVLLQIFSDMFGA